MDLAAELRDASEKCFDQGGLARPIAADNSESIATVDREIQLFSEYLVFVPDGQVFDGQNIIPRPFDGAQAKIPARFFTPDGLDSFHSCEKRPARFCLLGFLAFEIFTNKRLSF